MLTLTPVSLTDCFNEYCRYACSLRLVDTFWDDMILNAEIFRIADGETPLGYASLYQEESLLTSFFLYENETGRLQEAFSLVQETLSPKGARIVTGDEVFLSAVFDYAVRTEPQAYFFDLTDKPPASPEFPRVWFYEAKEEDLPDLRETGFYHPARTDDPENRIFVLRNPAGAFMGTGHIARSPFNRGWGSVGMYTAPEFRRTGVGRSMILFLTEIAKESGLTPICGCYFHNTASRRTLESCGYASRTRYVNFYFEENA